MVDYVRERALSTTARRRGIFLLMPSSARVRRVLDLAAELNTKEWADVAAELIAGLGGAEDEDLKPDEWKRAWHDEIARRLSDRRPGIPWEKARAQVQRTLASVRAQRDR